MQESLVSGEAGPVLPLEEELSQGQGYLAGRGTLQAEGSAWAKVQRCAVAGTWPQESGPLGQCQDACPGDKELQADRPGLLSPALRGDEGGAWQGRGRSEGNWSPCWVPTLEGRGRCGLGVMERWEAGESRGVWPK